MLCLNKVDHLPWDFDKSYFGSMIHSSSRSLQLSSSSAGAAPPAGEASHMFHSQNATFCSAAAGTEEQHVGQSIPPCSKVEDHNRTSTESNNNKHAILFPTKLRCILDDAVTEGNEHIVSWLPDGKAFKIHNPEAFTKVILRRYFRQTMFKSFTRQLYHYGFSKLNDDLDHNTFSHPQFRRDDFESCLTIDRKKHKTTATAPHLHVITAAGQQISLASSSSSSPYPTSPIITTMPVVHETLILGNEGGNSLRSPALHQDHQGTVRSYRQVALVSPRKDSEDPQLFQEQCFDSRGCFFQDSRERNSLMFKTSKGITSVHAQTSSTDDWLGRLENSFQLGPSDEGGCGEQQQSTYHIGADSIDTDALTIFEPRTLEEMTLFPMSFPSMLEAIIRNGL